MADTHLEPEPVLSRAPRLCAMANRRDLHIHNIIFQFQDVAEENHYQTVLVPLDRPSLCTPALSYFYDDQAELEALCQCYYAKRTTGSMARFMRTNRLRGINSGAVPYVVSVFIEQYEGSTDFIPICHACAAPRNVKVTSRGDRSRHITIRLVYSGEPIQIMGLNSLRQRYRQLQGYVGSIGQALGNDLRNRLRVSTFPLSLNASAEHIPLHTLPLPPPPPENLEPQPGGSQDEQE